MEETHPWWHHVLATLYVESIKQFRYKGIRREGNADYSTHRRPIRSLFSSLDFGFCSRYLTPRPWGQSRHKQVNWTFLFRPDSRGQLNFNWSVFKSARCAVFNRRFSVIHKQRSTAAASVVTSVFHVIMKHRSKSNTGPQDWCSHISELAEFSEYILYKLRFSCGRTTGATRASSHRKFSVSGQVSKRLSKTYFISTENVNCYHRFWQHSVVCFATAFTIHHSNKYNHIFHSFWQYFVLNLSAVSQCYIHQHRHRHCHRIQLWTRSKSKEKEKLLTASVKAKILDRE